MEWTKQLKNPPKEYSPLAFWFLYGELESEKLRWQIDQMVEKGVYGGFMHPRAYLKTPYLEEEWWDAIGACIDEAKKTGFDAWLYDEYAWPSGTAGSIFTYGLQKPSRTLSEGACNMGKGLSCQKFYSLVKLKTVHPEIAQFEDGKNTLPVEKLAEKALCEGKQLYCVVQKGDIFYAFYINVYPKNVDYMNKETIQKFISLTHEEYKKRYSEEFGKHIPGIFFDEIYMHGPLPWTYILPDRFYEEYHYDLLKELPCLIDGDTSYDMQVRRNYYQMIGILYEEAFFKQISGWCAENNLKMTGHTDELLWQHANTQGNYFDTMRHLMIPGSDCHDFRYRYPRRITYVEAKYSVAVARAYGKNRAMSEALGGAGWNCPLEDFKRGILTMAALGTSMFILHGFFYECEHQGSQSDWPNSFFYQNPYWKYFKTFSDYISRLCYTNSTGRPVVHYGLYYPIETMASYMVDGQENLRGRQLSEAFHTVLNTMIEYQMDIDLIDSSSIERAAIQDGRLSIGQQEFYVLFLPERITLTEAVKQKLKKWLASGGKIVYYKYEKECRDKQEYGDERESLEPETFFMECPVCSPLDASGIAAGFKVPDVRIIGKRQYEVYINHRCIERKEVFLVCNCGEEKQELLLAFQKDSIGIDNITAPVLYNIETGAGHAIPYQVNDEQEILTELILEAAEGVYVVFEDNEGTTISKQEIKQERKQEEEIITGKWDFLLFPAKPEENMIYNDLKECILEIPVARVAASTRTGSDLIRICDVGKECGACKEFVSEWNAYWITRRPSWASQLGAVDLFYKKSFYIDGNITGAEFTIAAVDTYEVFINGEKEAEGISNGIPAVFMTGQFKTGDNEVLIHVINHHSLNEAHVCAAEKIPKECINTVLFEGDIHTEQGPVKLISDRSWMVSDRLNSTESILYYDVATLKNVNIVDIQHEWIPSWEIGKPPVLPWGNLPLFNRKLQYPVELYYTVEIPVGAIQIYKPLVEGDAKYLLDGVPIDWKKEEYTLERNNSRHVLNVILTAHSEEDGLKKAVKIKVAPCRVNLGNWELLGYSWHSGRGKYSTELTVRKKTGHCILELGKVNFCVEVWVNRELAGIRIWDPYRLDITEFLKEGTNKLDIIISNLEGNERRYMLVKEGRAMGWNRYWHEENLDRDSQNYVSGLLGPVKIIWSDE